MNKYYTYAYLREDGTPYYIGKGLKYRWNSKNHKVAVPTGERILILKENLSEEDAIKHEIYMINIFGRKDLGTGILRNLTNGGDGISGFKHSPATKIKIGLGNTNKKRSAITRKKVSEAIKGFKWYTNGKETIQSFEHPGVEWVEGRVCTWESPTNSGMQWYNKNGKNIQCFNDPGENWDKGMLREKYNNPTNGGKNWYNNGEKNKMFISPPDNSWVNGMIRRK